MSNYQILTPSGWSDFHGVRRKYSDNIIHVKTECAAIKCTRDHLLKTDQGAFIEAGSNAIGQILATADGTTLINDVVAVAGEMVYDLIEVEKNNEYYTNDLISHNCQFLGSSGTLISGAALKRLKPREPLHVSDGLKMFESPIDDHRYVITVDVSRGKGLDYSAFQVLDVSAMPYTQVCTYRNNMVTPLDYSGTIFRIAKAYKNAAVMVEINDIGGQVADSLHYDYEYDNIIYTENAGARGKRISAGFGKSSSIDRGIRTTQIVKSVGCSMLKLLIEQGQLLISDGDTIYELSRFSQKGKSYEAEAGATDDLTMALVLFAWMTDQQYFKELTDIATLAALRDKTDDELSDDFVPFGFIETGHDSYSSVIDLDANPEMYSEFLNF